MTFFTLSWSLFLLLSVNTHVSVSQVFTESQRKIEVDQPPTLGEVLMQVIDTNKDKKVKMKEVWAQLTTLTQLFQEGDNNEYIEMIEMAKVAAPHVFEFLDSDGDKSLSRSELAFTTKFENSLKKGGGMKSFVRDCFEILDADGDGNLSVDELVSASGADSDTLSKVAAKFHELFPVRPTSKEIEDFVQKSVFQSFGEIKVDKESIESFGVMSWLDEDGDGFIQRKEVGKAYNAAGKKILETIKSIKTMGPMLSMFAGGMGGGGMNNMMGNEF